MNETNKGREHLIQELEELRQRNAELSKEVSLRSVLASMEDLVFVLDEKGVFKRYFQGVGKKDLYIDPSRFLKRHFRDVMPPEVSAQFQKSIDALGVSGVSQELEFSLEVSGGREWYHALVSNWMTSKNERVGFVVVVRNISKPKQMEEALKEALAKVKLLSGFLPICAVCKKIRDDKGYWNQIESYIRDHSEAEFSHGICPECAKKLYPDYIDDDKQKDA